MLRSLVVLGVILGAQGSRIQKPTPGTETILLVKGGYGPGLNLISTTPATTKRRHGVHKAPMDRTEKEEVEVKSLEEVSKGVTMLQSQIADVGQETAKVLSESEAARVERAKVSEQLVADTKRVEQLEVTDHQMMQLQAQAQHLRSQIAAEQAKTAAEKARSKAFQTKVQLLETDIRTLSKAWQGMSKHKAAVAKAAWQEIEKPTAKEKATRAPKKADHPVFKGWDGHVTDADPKDLATAKSTRKEQSQEGQIEEDMHTLTKVLKEKQVGAKKAKKLEVDDDITDDVLTSDSEEDGVEDAAKVDSDSESVSSDDSDADTQADDDSEGSDDDDEGDQQPRSLPLVSQ